MCCTYMYVGLQPITGSNWAKCCHGGRTKQVGEETKWKGSLLARGVHTLTSHSSLIYMRMHIQITDYSTNLCQPYVHVCTFSSFYSSKPLFPFLLRHVYCITCFSSVCSSTRASTTPSICKILPEYEHMYELYVDDLQKVVQETKQTVLNMDQQGLIGEW